MAIRYTVLVLALFSSVVLARLEPITFEWRVQRANFYTVMLDCTSAATCIPNHVRMLLLEADVINILYVFLKVLTLFSGFRW